MSEMVSTTRRDSTGSRPAAPSSITPLPPAGRVLAPVLLAVTVSLLAAACTSTGAISNAAKYLSHIRHAGAATIAGSTAGVALQVSIGGSGTLPIDQGEIDLAHGLTSIAAVAKPPGSSTPATIRGVDTPTVIYQELLSNYAPKGLKQPLPALLGGKTWEQLTSTLGSSGIQGNAQYFNSEIYNPFWLLSTLGGASAPVKDLGSSTVGTVSATHYSFRVNLQAAAASSQAVKAGLGPIMSDEAAFLGVATFPAQVWLDNQGRVVQLFVTLTFPSSKYETAVKTRPAATVELILSGYGSPISPISVPPASSVATAQQVNQVEAAAQSATPPSTTSSSSPSPGTGSGG